MKKVSVVIPVYNVERYIERCLNSLLCQTWDNYEIICADDCGTDRSMAIVDDFAVRYPERIVTLKRERNTGPGGARDDGVKIAAGDYIVFVDSDDYVEPDYLERYMSAILEQDADVVLGGHWRTGEKGNQPFPVDTTDETSIWTRLGPWAKIYRKAFLAEHGLDFRGVRRYEDEGFWYRLLNCRPKTALIDYIGYHYWINPTSITQGNKTDRSNHYVEYIPTVRQVAADVLPTVQDPELFRYLIVSGLTANLLYNGKGCGGKKMKQLYQSYHALVQEIDPNICRNRYIPFRQVKSEPKLQRCATWLVLRFRRLKLDRVLFWIDSLL